MLVPSSREGVCVQDARSKITRRWHHTLVAAPSMAVTLSDDPALAMFGQWHTAGGSQDLSSSLVVGPSGHMVALPRDCGLVRIS
jgi:hypothetical protein